MSLRVVQDDGEALSRDELQERGNELAAQIKRATAEAVSSSMLSDVFERGPLRIPQMKGWKSQVRRAIKAWQEVEALISELLRELDKFETKSREGKRLTAVPDPSGKPGHFVMAWVDAPKGSGDDR